MVLPRITIFGAGCIGSYLAGILLPMYAHSPNKVSIIARDKQCDSLKNNGLCVNDYLGNKNITPNIVNVFSHTQLENKKPEAADILLLTVKCTAIDECLKELTHCIDNKTLIICLQNGVGSELSIKQAFPNNNVIKAIVGFNVIKLDKGVFYKASEGEVIFEHINTFVLNVLIELLNQQNTKSYSVKNYSEIQWGKLLLNLNNAINALAGIPLKEELQQRLYRKVLAASMTETLTVLKKAKINPAKLTPVPFTLLPFILTLPTFLFSFIAKRMLAIDPSARSSMWYDIEENKLTEIAFINGAVVQLGKQVKTLTPVNEKIVSLIEEYSHSQQGSPKLSGIELLNKVLN